MIRAADLKHTVEFQRVTETRDESGDLIESWSTLDENNTYRKVAIYPLRGREYFTGLLFYAEVTYKVVCYWDSGLSTLRPKDRIVYGSRIFNIRSVLNIEEANRQYDILVTEVT